MGKLRTEIALNVDRELHEEAELIVDKIMRVIDDELELQKNKKGALSQNSLQKEESLKQVRGFITEWMTGEDQRQAMMEALDIIETEGKNFDQGKILLEEFQTIGKRLIERIEKEDQEKKVFHTVQEWLELSNESLQILYKMGVWFFDRQKNKKAIAIFTLITILNNFIFEPWLALGIAFKIEKNYVSAIHAFAMASLINLEHPMPHIQSAELYFLSGNFELGKATLDYCLSLLSKEDKKKYSTIISNLLKRYHT